MRTFPKKLYLLFLTVFLFTSVIINAQGINITSGGTIAVSGAAQIAIDNGDFVNNGTYSKGTESVIMSGSTAKTMSGSGTTNMYNLSVTNTAGITTKLGQLGLNNLSISSSSKFIIDTTSAVIASNRISNDAGLLGLVIKSSSSAANGSLVFHNAPNDPVLASVEMFSKASWTNTNGKISNYKWQFFGIPVKSISDVSPVFDGSYIRKYNETGNGSGLASNKRWIQLQSGAIEKLLGYEVVQSAGKTYTFSGELFNESIIDRQLTYTSTADYPGQHVFGNPYTAAIDIQQLEFGSQTEATVYQYNSGSMSDWTSNSGVSNVGTSPGQYIASPKETAGAEGIPRQIPSMQGFVVKAMSDSPDATFSIPYSSVAMKNSTMQKVSSKVDTSIPYTIIDVKGTRYNDRMWIFINPLCTRNFDNGWDGRKMYGTSVNPQLCALEDDGDYQIDAISDIEGTELGFWAGEDNTYTLTFTHKDLDAKYPTLYLQDLANNSVTNISQSGSSYTFAVNRTTDPEKRFKIVTTNGQITDKVAIPIPNVNVYASGKTVFVDYNEKNTPRLQMFNCNGKSMLESTLNANGLTKIATSLNPGIYVVKLYTLKETIVRRVIIH